jgi:hypothetical protein
LKLLLVLVVMVSIIPLAVLGGTGRLDRAWQALREYLLCMAILTVPALIVAGIALAPSLWSYATR